MPARSLSRSLFLPLLSLAACLGGCPATTRPGHQMPDTLGDRRVLRLSTPMASHYGERRPVSSDGIEARVLSALGDAARSAGRVVPVTDLSARRAATEICRVLPPSGPPPSRVVEFALRSQGIIDPPPHMVIANLPDGLDDEVLVQLGSRFREIMAHKDFSRVGIGVVQPEGSRLSRVLVALLEHRIDLVPIPRRLARDQRVGLRFRSAPSHHNLHLVLTPPDGKIVSTRPVQACREAADCGSAAALSCGLRGVYQVEITGEGQFGPEVLANFPVFCDQDPPSQVRYGATRPLKGDVELLERALFQGTNRVRTKAGLSALALDPRLTAVARRHSKDMRDSRFVGHVSPSTGRPVDRLRAAKVLHLVLRENVAQAYSVQEALRELLNSPAHRENILSRDVTVMGVGVVLDRRASTPVMLLTQLFMKPGKAYDPRTARAEVLGAIRRSRARVGLPPLAVDEALSQLAGEHVKVLLSGGGTVRSRADATLGAALQRMGDRFGRIDGLHVRLSVIDALEQAEEIQRKRYAHLGIGVGRSGEQIVIFLLLAGGR